MSADSMMDGAWMCVLCERHIPLSTPIADLECACAICPACVTEHLLPLLKPVPHQQTQSAASAPVYRKGQRVLYSHNTRGRVPALIAEVDASIQPPQYGVRLEGAAADELRYTEQARLLPSLEALQPGASAA
jgi:hypothetical protein